MDALAGYGSDSSAESSEGNGSSGRVAEGGGGGGGGGALSALLPTYSSSEDEANEKAEAPGRKGAGGTVADADTAGTEAKKDGSDGRGANEGNSAPRKKRRRRWDNPDSGAGESKAAGGRPALPPPRLSGASADGGDGDGTRPGAFEELILFEKDYTAKLRSRPSSTDGKAPAANPELVEKLNRLHQSFYSAAGGGGGGGTANERLDSESGRPASFASHLRSQHEFGNPHLFPSVVSHCGIEPRGTNLSSTLWDPAEFKEFEVSGRLLAAEEQARVAAAERARVGE